jgi:hypothetical protein
MADIIILADVRKADDSANAAKQQQLDALAALLELLDAWFALNAAIAKSFRVPK